ENVHRLPHPYNTQEEAKAAAKSKLDELNRGDASLNMTLLGNADITAEGRITISKLRNDVNGDYIVKSATHSLSSDAVFSTSIQAYVEKG
ncbi:MAG: hypothetical protein V3T17_07420, partial [Pseudomonadales bacterium]